MNLMLPCLPYMNLMLRCLTFTCKSTERRRHSVTVPPSEHRRQSVAVTASPSKHRRQSVTVRASLSDRQSVTVRPLSSHVASRHVASRRVTSSDPVAHHALRDTKMHTTNRKRHADTPPNPKQKTVTTAAVHYTSPSGNVRV